MVGTGSTTLEVTLHNAATEIPRAHQALDQLAAAKGLPNSEVSPLHIALEEHLTNVISYGYDPGQPGAIRLRIMFEPSVLRIEIEDDARPFNPLEAPDVDTSLPLEAKPIGGLGLHMIRKCVDELQYKRYNERNVLLLKKSLGPSTG